MNDVATPRFSRTHAAGAVALLAWATLEWVRYTYRLEADSLRIEEGVLARKLRVIPFDRIQQVDLIRKPLHRVLGDEGLFGASRERRARIADLIGL